MTNAIMSRLAVQSYCFRTYKEHDGLIQALKACEIGRLEMCGVHLNPLVEADVDGVLAKYKENGISFTAFGVHNFTANEDENRQIFEFAKKAGIGVITAHFKPGSLPSVEKLCEEYGIKAALHNHGRKHIHGAVHAIQELFSTASDNIGFCLDTAWMLDMREDVVAVAKKFRDRLIAVHLKDFIFDRSGKPEDVMLGTGNLKLKEFLTYLVESGYSGDYTLEYEGDIENPVPSIRRCKELIALTAAEIAEATVSGEK